MKRLKSTDVAVVILCFLLLIGVVNSSDADIKIVELSAFGYTSSGGGTSLSVSVKTNEPYDQIDIYFGEELIGQTFSGNEVKTSAHFNLWYNLTDGSVKGKKYEIRAEAWRENDGDPSEDTEYYYLTLYQPEVSTEVVGGGGQQHPDVFGYVELTRHYFDGTNIIVEGYVSAYNASAENVNCSAWFKHTLFNSGGFDPQDDAPSEVIGPPQDNPPIKRTYGPHSADSMVLNFFVGGQIGDESYELNAHIHLVTGVDNRHVDSTNWFDSNDNLEP